MAYYPNNDDEEECEPSVLRKLVKYLEDSERIHEKRVFHRVPIIKAILDAIDESKLLQLYMVTRFIGVTRDNMQHYVNQMVSYFLDYHKLGPDFTFPSLPLADNPTTSCTVYYYLMDLHKQPHLLVGYLMDRFNCEVYRNGPDHGHFDCINRIRRQTFRAAVDIFVKALIHNCFNGHNPNEGMIRCIMETIHDDVLANMHLQYNVLHLPLRKTSQPWVKALIQDLKAAQLDLPLARINMPEAKRAAAKLQIRGTLDKTLDAKKIRYSVRERLARRRARYLKAYPRRKFNDESTQRVSDHYLKVFVRSSPHNWQQQGFTDQWMRYVAYVPPHMWTENDWRSAESGDPDSSDSEDDTYVSIDRYLEKIVARNDNHEVYDRWPQASQTLPLVRPDKVYDKSKAERYLELPELCDCVCLRLEKSCTNCADSVPKSEPEHADLPRLMPPSSNDPNRAVEEIAGDEGIHLSHYFDKDQMDILLRPSTDGDKNILDVDADIDRGVELGTFDRDFVIASFAYTNLMQHYAQFANTIPKHYRPIGFHYDACITRIRLTDDNKPITEDLPGFFEVFINPENITVAQNFHLPMVKIFPDKRPEPLVVEGHFLHLDRRIMPPYNIMEPWWVGQIRLNDWDYIARAFSYMKMLMRSFLQSLNDQLPKEIKQW